MEGALSPAVGLLLPGDELPNSGPEPSGEHRRLGFGVRQGPSCALATVPGRPSPRDSGQLSIDSLCRHYFVRPGDQVVGVVEDRGADFFRVNIFSGSPALLGRTSFDGASKRNRPDLKRGDVVYCKVSLAEPGMDVGKDPADRSQLSSHRFRAHLRVLGRRAEGLDLGGGGASCRPLSRPKAVLVGLRRAGRRRPRQSPRLRGQGSPSAG